MLSFQIPARTVPSSPPLILTPRLTHQVDKLLLSVSCWRYGLHLKEITSLSERSSTLSASSANPPLVSGAHQCAWLPLPLSPLLLHTIHITTVRSRPTPAYLDLDGLSDRAQSVLVLSFSILMTPMNSSIHVPNEARGRAVSDDEGCRFSSVECHPVDCNEMNSPVPSTQSR